MSPHPHRLFCFWLPSEPHRSGQRVRSQMALPLHTNRMNEALWTPHTHIHQTRQTEQEWCPLSSFPTPAKAWIWPICRCGIRRVPLVLFKATELRDTCSQGGASVEPAWQPSSRWVNSHGSQVASASPNVCLEFISGYRQLVFSPADVPTGCSRLVLNFAMVQRMLHFQWLLTNSFKYHLRV